MIALRRTICSMLVLSAAAASARAATIDDRSFSATFENDIFQGQDQGYTNGARLAWTAPESHEPKTIGFLERNLISPLAGDIPFFAPDGKKRVSYGIGQSIFTPRDITTPTPNPRDEPYAGWLYGSVGMTSDTGKALDSLELQVGVVGPWSFAEQTQKFVHRDIDPSPEPKGWDHQLDNEPGIVLSYEHKWRKFYSASALGFDMDFTPNVDASLGNVFTMASVGGTVRLGQNIPDDYGPPRIRPSIGGSDFYESADDFGWYLFLGTEGRAVARNIFLDGNTFGGGPDVDKEPFVGDLQGGAAVFYKNVRLSFSSVYRSKEFKTQDYNHGFGVLALTVNY